MTTTTAKTRPTATSFQLIPRYPPGKSNKTALSAQTKAVIGFSTVTPSPFGEVLLATVGCLTPVIPKNRAVMTMCRREATPKR